jgi:hypothetical protein
MNVLVLRAVIGSAARTRAAHRLWEIILAKRFVCSSSKPKFDKDKYFMCRHCLRHQHYDCADFEEEMTIHEILCNKCAIPELQRLITIREETAGRIRQRVDQKRQGMIGVLWNQYCILPNNNAPQAVIDATATRFVNGRMIPFHVAPGAWVDEILAAMEAMAEAAKEDDYASTILPNTGAYHYENDKILTPYRELAVWMIHHGPWEGQRDKLGVLAEVLGLEVKGTYWKGAFEEDRVGDSQMAERGWRAHSGGHGDIDEHADGIDVDGPEAEGMDWELDDDSDRLSLH